ncbi:MAG: cell division transport system permease protein [Patescibacteria group bacterium]|jgi:cell division transport system permease protein|nr:cell division transport system permease protein [Patescibacteria group bacterium]
MAKKNLVPRAFQQNKTMRRKWLTFVRMCRYGVNNFSRNTWLSIAATAVMTITLLIIFMTLVARQVLVDTVDAIKGKTDMSIYVRTDTSAQDAESIQDAIKQLPGVNTVRYISPEDARNAFAKDNKSDAQTLEALNEAVNKFPGTFRVNIVDINDPSQLDKFVKTNELYKAHADPNRQPSFNGQRRDAIQKIGQAVQFAERTGLIASTVFIIISSLIIFNTIRMAIFNRKEEIQMMKLIGADRGFIRGPFVVEAIVYGFIAALIATGLGVAALYGVKDKLAAYDIAIGHTVELVTEYIPFVILLMIVAGAIIGIVSSLFATRKYLKI